ncbi:FAD-dependent oxidoreductase [Epibacterium sp. SM1979]|uniref:FAD-dependent oxidoreductase n=1 Tax=Tritonibacter litoralis TaxID=2662264 RepID=A0A843YE54_9RHOB|nr:NAD(P)/FAD-dependent oxidoreductase [Tritonibacter litoralis]MQQ07744.1 FAD-dependent oxidoreductase [Tritonibacter litoralis]
MSKVYDVAIIGAGVIGCAIARRLTLDGARVIVLEKAPDILDGASKANSAILHTGFDAPQGSLELACVQEGYKEYEALRGQMNLPLDRCGALVLAWTEDQEARLPILMEQAHANGVEDVAPLSRTETLALESALNSTVRASFRVPRESLIDPWSAPHAYLLQALLNGADLKRDCPVLAGQFDGRQWTLTTPRGDIQATYVINAAGLYGDKVDLILLGQSSFNIRPRKGQFVVFDKMAARLTQHILLPVPTETTKGIVVCRTIWGNLLVGPTAEEQEDRETAGLDQDTLEMLRAKGAEILPELASEEVTSLYAGLRPACEHKEYQIKTHPDTNMVTVGAIRSTGLSSALGTAAHVGRLLEGLGHQAQPIKIPDLPQMGMLAEHETRDWQRAGNQGILCHCEKVTYREAMAVLNDPLAPKSFAGFKRRTRASMGRCQGFYCGQAVQSLLDEKGLEHD